MLYLKEPTNIQIQFFIYKKKKSKNVHKSYIKLNFKENLIKKENKLNSKLK